MDSGGERQSVPVAGRRLRGGVGAGRRCRIDAAIHRIVRDARPHLPQPADRQATRSQPYLDETSEVLMFRIRRIHDDVLPVNQAAIREVQQIFAEQFPDASPGRRRII